MQEIKQYFSLTLKDLVIVYIVTRKMKFLKNKSIIHIVLAFAFFCFIFYHFLISEYPINIFSKKNHVYAGKFTAALVLLFLFGAFLQDIFRIPWIGNSSFFAGRVLLSQIILILYVYARSLLNNIIYFPIGYPDLILFFAAIGLFVFRHPGYIKKIILKSIPVLATFYFLIMVSVSRELPREVMLSSDPDQHLFWALQLKKFGTIPLTQFDWGNEPFNYPAGFAVLNYIWNAISFTKMIEVVQMQAFLQTILSILLALEILRKFFSEVKRKYFVIMPVLFASWITLFPYGYIVDQVGGIGRIGSIFFITASISFLFYYMNFLFYKAREIQFKDILFFFSLLLVLILINPINIFIQSLIYLFIIPFFVFGRRNRIVSYSVLSLPVFAFILADPYYFNRIIGNKIYTLTSERKNLAFTDIISNLRNSTFDILGQEIGRIYLILENEFVSGYMVLILMISVTSIVIFEYKVRFSESMNSAKSFLQSLLKESVVPAIFILFLTSVFICRFIVRIIPDYNDLHLLDGYIEILRKQILFIFLIIFVGFISAKILEKLHFGYIAIFAILFYFHIPDSELISRIPRKFNRCGFLGEGPDCISPDDYSVIGKIRAMYISHRKGKNSDEIKKRILVLNFPDDRGFERWLFPFGASRLLPDGEMFPLAFYYFQGDADYTLENYLKYVCREFNRDWLKSKNIRYIFIPSKPVKSCLFKTEERLKTERILFNSGKTYFLEIN